MNYFINDRQIKILSTIIVVFVISVMGCQKGMPKNFPQLVPASIVVLKSGNPVENVVITLCPESPCSWSCGGSTDSSGNLILSTVQGSYSRLGAPIGNYAVTVTYTPIIDSDKDTSMMSAEERIAYANVQKNKIKKAKAEFGIPEILGNMTKTPVKWTINSQEVNKLTIEVNDYKK